MESTKKDVKTQIKTKKRIAPEKATDSEIAISEDIIAASFELSTGSVTETHDSTAGVAKGGITININTSPMVHVQQMLQDHGLQWGIDQSHTEGISGSCRAQLNVVKRVLERQMRLYQVRDALLDSEAESSGDSIVDEEGSLSDGHHSEEGETSSSQNANLKDGDLKEQQNKEDEMEVELDQEAEEWGLKNIGDYDLEDEFIDDSEAHHYFKNVNKKSKYAGFYIHKGPLKLIEQKPEAKAPKKCKTGDGKSKPATTGGQSKAKGSSNDKTAQKKTGQQVPYTDIRNASGSGSVLSVSLQSVPELRERPTCAEGGMMTKPLP